MQTAWITRRRARQYFHSPRVLARSPHIRNRLLREQLTRQQPGKRQPSGAAGDPGSPL